MRPWVCLMYHDVLPGRAVVSGGKEYFAVPAGAFARQLDAIRTLGLTGCSLEVFLSDPGPGRVVLTFDDGDAGQYGHAFAALTDRGFSATFFVTTGWVGGRGFATWAQLREMREAGMSIQSHTRTHPFLSQLDDRQLRAELAGARQDLGEHLGQESDQLSLPGGDWPRRQLRHLISEAGYRVVATSRWGGNRMAVARPRLPLVVRRCTVRGEPSDAVFARIVLGDPWLAATRQTRDLLLGSTRALLGPPRYARWRRGVLGALGGGESAAPPP